ncbi:hypothetical protein LTS07_001506 [Exophiala sideris]|uniref:DUF7908 domain-containing protein n=1 Tax=Exophiala sideris TaxID=1016849 RepID=A0ABR0JNZ5_9EURO|nr:hypothetical protein LTS07_001506 [Exophiala sideris]KAK5044020.1 hypothetical protein LTR13_000376 [Exophiala sideris]KAK5067519.1 hypothetical protein LTR69_001508 [Exophiala sideris]KAK5184243.1 hypothetical protein LTR44_003749 [Eurotiomycetes sp. CCFEE 6388]
MTTSTSTVISVSTTSDTTTTTTSETTSTTTSATTTSTPQATGFLIMIQSTSAKVRRRQTTQQYFAFSTEDTGIVTDTQTTAATFFEADDGKLVSDGEDVGSVDADAGSLIMRSSTLMLFLRSWSFSDGYAQLAGSEGFCLDSEGFLSLNFFNHLVFHYFERNLNNVLDHKRKQSHFYDRLQPDQHKFYLRIISCYIVLVYCFDIKFFFFHKPGYNHFFFCLNNCINPFFFLGQFFDFFSDTVDILFFHQFYNVLLFIDSSISKLYYIYVDFLVVDVTHNFLG